MVFPVIWNDQGSRRFHGFLGVAERRKPDPAAGAGSPLVLVAMPDALVLFDLAQVIRGLGFRNIVTAATPESFAAALARNRHDAAILDCDFLDTGDSGTISQLAALGKRLLLLSGYGADFVLPTSLIHATLLAKPMPAEAIARHLAGLTKTGEA